MDEEKSNKKQIKEVKEEIKEVKEELKKKAHEKVLEKASTLKNEYKKQVSTAIMTALGLVIALVWKDVVNAILPSITAPSFLENYPLLANLYTASAVTAIAVIGIIFIANWAKSQQPTDL
ncbi:MAG: DUF5654 family protein [Candidatus Nanoarchaeia archaeon]|nr:DUF5654 family protein [Candidatus Nanoarchaeia archaeon]